jgi:hypothetical protein
MDRLDLILLFPYLFLAYETWRSNRMQRNMNKFIEILIKIIEKDGCDESTKSN